MTTSEQTPLNQYTGNSSADTYAYEFRIYDEADLDVYLDGVLQTLTTHYTVTGVDNDAGGTVVFVSAPSNGASITITRTIAQNRLAGYPQSGKFDSSVVNEDFDRLVSMVQELTARLDRAITVSVTNTVSADLELPSPEASKFLAWNASGDALINGSATSSPVSTFMETVVDDTSAAQARQTLGVVTSSAQSLTIASGAVAPTGPGWLTITSETGSSDTLDTITIPSGMSPGQEFFLVAASGHTITLSAAGNLVQATGEILNETQPAHFRYNGTNLVRVNPKPVCSLKAPGISNSTGVIQYTVDPSGADSHGFWDGATNYRYTPLIPGWYRATVTGHATPGGATLQSGSQQIDIRKNGSSVRTTGRGNTGSSDQSGSNLCCTADIQCNGSSDYIDFYLTIGVDRINDYGGVTIEYLRP